MYEHAKRILHILKSKKGVVCVCVAQRCMMQSRCGTRWHVDVSVRRRRPLAIYWLFGLTLFHPVCASYPFQFMWIIPPIVTKHYTLMASSSCVQKQSDVAVRDAFADLAMTSSYCIVKLQIESFMTSSLLIHAPRWVAS